MVEFINILKEKLYYNKIRIIMFAILLLAFMLRIWGIGFGLPYIYSTDEWFEVKRALKLGAGLFEFERTGKGGYFYLLFIEYGIYYLILKLFGLMKQCFIKPRVHSRLRFWVWA